MALYNKKLRKAAFKKVNKGTGGVPPPPSIAKVMLFSDSANNLVRFRIKSGMIGNS